MQADIILKLIIVTCLYFIALLVLNSDIHKTAILLTRDMELNYPSGWLETMGYLISLPSSRTWIGKTAGFVLLRRFLSASFSPEILYGDALSRI